MLDFCIRFHEYPWLFGSRDFFENYFNDLNPFLIGYVSRLTVSHVHLMSIRWREKGTKRIVNNTELIFSNLFQARPHGRLIITTDSQTIMFSNTSIITDYHSLGPALISRSYLCSDKKLLLFYTSQKLIDKLSHFPLTKKNTSVSHYLALSGKESLIEWNLLNCSDH